MGAWFREEQKRKSELEREPLPFEFTRRNMPPETIEERRRRAQQRRQAAKTSSIDFDNLARRAGAFNESDSDDD